MIKVPVPSIQGLTRSRNVRRYVLAVLRRAALNRALQGTNVEVADAYRRLTGGQVAEANRIVAAVLHADGPTRAATDPRPVDTAATPATPPPAPPNRAPRPATAAPPCRGRHRGG